MVIRIILVLFWQIFETLLDTIFIWFSVSFPHNTRYQLSSSSVGALTVSIFKESARIQMFMYVTEEVFLFFGVEVMDVG